MSTILKTLQKLEEEKSVLDRRADLRELVLKDDLSGVLEEDSGSRPWLVGVLVVLSFALGALWVYTRTGEAPRPAAVNTSVKPAVKTPPVKSAPPGELAALPAPSPTGIPLANIPETAETPASGVEEDFSWIEDELELEFENGAEEASAPAPDLAASPAASGAQAAGEPAPEPEAAAEKAIPVPAEIREIDALIKDATQAALTAPADPAPAAAGEAPRDLKVKAIIYFDDGSPGNHIFVTTPKKGNLKMKVGDEVDGARLAAIAPNRVVFDYQGKTVEIRVGH